MEITRSKHYKLGCYLQTNRIISIGYSFNSHALVTVYCQSEEHTSDVIRNLTGDVISVHT
jgi:hypothetical protein